MEAERKQQLMDLGVDVEEMLERFMGNTAMVEKFLKKFLLDSHYQTFKEALEADDLQKAFEEAHALKGVCGNLSLVTLYEYISGQVDYLRTGIMDKAKEKLPELDAEYERVVNGLKEILN